MNCEQDVERILELSPFYPIENYYTKKGDNTEFEFSNSVLLYR